MRLSMQVLDKNCKRSLFCAWLVAYVVLLTLGLSGKAQAQAVPTARQQVRVSAFGMVSAVNPKYGGAKKNIGGTVGADLNLWGIGSRLSPSFEFRAVGSGGRVSNQYAYLVGPRLEARFGRFHPYGDFLFGYGKIVFNRSDTPSYQRDKAFVMAYGGGVDIDLSRNWALRVDGQAQRWRLTQYQPAFYPLQGSVGVRYRFHFHNKYSPE